MKNSNRLRGAVPPVLAVALLLLALAACNRDTAGADVMAAVNGRKIYRTEVDKYYVNQTAGSDLLPVMQRTTLRPATCFSDRPRGSRR